MVVEANAQAHLQMTDHTFEAAMRALLFRSRHSMPELYHIMRQLTAAGWLLKHLVGAADGNQNASFVRPRENLLASSPGASKLPSAATPTTDTMARCLRLGGRRTVR